MINDIYYLHEAMRQSNVHLNNTYGISNMSEKFIA